MHDTARETARDFWATYGPYIGPSASILEVGSLDINGSLRDVTPSIYSYWGVDWSPGPGVDQVITNLRDISLPRESVDVILSSSAFEHDPTFWITFQYFEHFLRRGGLLYINAPSNGPIHRHNLDCWRFYPDAAVALEKWSSGKMRLLETFIRPPGGEGWADCTMVFQRRGGPLPLGRIGYGYPHLISKDIR